ncbi:MULTISPECIES: hypothetical protein [Streptosporangium]|uniref:Alanine racemase n=1 Tax=Streptosporangium brasiliense TaxID=47480 RepID=A0ABT9R5E9_9ACTN|nr:hypothetical protein [Streptosporangium brasiliense]MDP9864467.1 hypothetical protein [Streptosporangium brasiliense]
MYLELDIPALVIDLDAVRADVAEMAKVAAAHGVEGGRAVTGPRVAARGAVRRS